ncbi:MAG: metal dependent phosphohydrolase [uncultured bacterium]|nr:MAG: metal dependent phosphohydrolase [uncultured bacterium]
MFERIENNSKSNAVENLEGRENFEGQKVLVIGGPDGHGVSMAVASAQYLEQRGAEAVIYSGSPVIREGKGATHPGAFYSKTLPNFNLEEYDRVVIADIPLDFRDLKNSERRIIELTGQLDKSREKRKAPKILKPVFFLDHHSTTTFEDSYPSEKEDIPAPKNIESHGAIIKTVDKAELCRLGNEPSKISRIGAICDRDAATLPITEEEMILAKGLDAAVRPDANDSKPMLPKGSNEDEERAYEKNLRDWENRAQSRLEEAIKRLKAEDWEYFKKEAERLNRVEIPTASGYGEIAIVDTQDLTEKFAVLKLMEMAVENSGVDKTPFAIGVLRDLSDTKMGRERADIISIIRHWTREDLQSVEDIITEKFGKEFIDKYKVYGAKNAKVLRLPVNDRQTAELVANLVEIFAGKEMPDFSDVKSVVMCGDPNSGKSVYSAIFKEALKTLGVSVAHLDLDKAAPTPQWYLDAEIAHKEAEYLFSKEKISQEKLDESKRKLDEAIERRKQMKRPWSIDLADEAKKELLEARADDQNDFVIGDIGGGRIKKDENGKIVKITRLTAENARILEGTDAVIIVSNNQQGAEEWKKLIEMGVDPETGVRINREKPIKIIGIYKSILEGSVQKVSEENALGVITNLDRSKAEKKYNPSIFTTAVFISKVVDRKKII